MLRTVIQVLLKPLYGLLTVAIATSVFVFVVWLPNFQLIGTVLWSSSVALADKIELLVNLLGSIGTNFTVLSASTTIIIAILFGVNVTLLVYYIRRARDGIGGVQKTGIVGIGGLVSGIFGIGCAACGTFILTSVLTIFGAAGFLTLLPFGGEEFGFLGIGLLSYSIYMLAKKINTPLICDVKTSVPSIPTAEL